MHRGPNNFVAAAVVGLVALTGCTSNGDEPPETSAPPATVELSSTTSSVLTSPDRNEGDGRLVFGALLDDENISAASAELGAQLAIVDVNAAGGVLLEDVFLSPGSPGASTNDTQQTVDRHLREGIDIILDGAPVGSTLDVLPKTRAAGVVHFSPISTDVEFGTAENSDLYFRTAPATTERAVVLANVANEQALQTVSVVFQETGDGPALAEAFRAQFQALGGEVEQLPFDTQADFGASATVLSAEPPSGIVVIGDNAEIADFITVLADAGIGPRAVAMYAISTDDTDLGALIADPALLNGMGVVEIGVDPERIETFVARVDARGDRDKYDYSAAAAGYDTIVVAALATEIAGTDRPEAMAEQIIGVTRDGVLCARYDECLELVQSGEDINYDGLSGPLEFVPPGEPSAASFVIHSYDGDATPNPSLDRYLFAR